MYTTDSYAPRRMLTHDEAVAALGEVGGRRAGDPDWRSRPRRDRPSDPSMAPCYDCSLAAYCGAHQQMCYAAYQYEHTHKDYQWARVRASLTAGAYVPHPLWARLAHSGRRGLPKDQLQALAKVTAEQTGKALEELRGAIFYGPMSRG